jgi:hypothetical protein
MDELLPIQNIIYEIRGKKVMLDSDLARLYEVETKVLNQAVKRNLARFPADFMFQLTEEEWRTIRPQFAIFNQETLRSQFVTSKITERRGGRQFLPYVFTEHGILMLSSVLVQNKIDSLIEKCACDKGSSNIPLSNCELKSCKF